jgi:hypothetical protein
VKNDTMVLSLPRYDEMRRKYVVLLKEIDVEILL